MIGAPAQRPFKRALAAGRAPAACVLTMLGFVLAGCGEAQGPAPRASTSEPVATRSAAPSASASAVSSSAPAVVATPPDAARRGRVEADVARIAIPRAPGSPGHATVQRHVQAELEHAGLTTTLEAFDGGTNIVARREGSRRSDEIVVLSAHYDHIQGCAGADDNASGVAVILEAARALRGGDRTLVIASWDREEDGLLGSAAWAAAARARGAKITLALSLDGVGYADRREGAQSLPPGADAVLPSVAKRLAENKYKGDFVVALGDTGAAPALAAFERFGVALGQPAYGVELAGLSRLALLDAARSDHASFWLHGYPALLVTDTANFRNPRYHCGAGPDDKSTLDYDMLARVTSLVIATTEEALRAP